MHTNSRVVGGGRASGTLLVGGPAGGPVVGGGPVVAGGPVGAGPDVVGGGTVVVEGRGTIWTGRTSGAAGKGGSTRTPKPSRIITVTAAVRAWKYATASRYWTRVLTILMVVIAPVVADLDQRIPGEEARPGGQHRHARLAALELHKNLAEAQRTPDRQHDDVPQPFELAHPSVSPPLFLAAARGSGSTDVFDGEIDRTGGSGGH